MKEWCILDRPSPGPAVCGILLGMFGLGWFLAIKLQVVFKMSLMDDSTVSSSPKPEEYANEAHLDTNRAKRRKLKALDGVIEASDSTSQNERIKTLVSKEKDTCRHPGAIAGLCIKCAEILGDKFGIAFEYIREGLRLASDEVVRLREKNQEKLLRHKKLCLVLDLDHTLLNATPFVNITQEEGYLMNESGPVQDAFGGSLYKLKSMQILAKLRPFVHTFLYEASKCFQMYIYTMATRAYALEMAKLLDPQKRYFDYRVITKCDCTRKRQKRLDVVLAQESIVIILDDTAEVWVKDEANLIIMERYLFFSSTCKKFRSKCKPLSELKHDENDSDGALATVLQLLKRIHSLFFDPELGENFADRDVRQVLKTVRGEVLKGCKILFSRAFITKTQKQYHPFWKMSEQMGAICAKEIDPSVTHVISAYANTKKSCWAVTEKKFLVDPRWLVAAYYLWKKQPEEKFLTLDGQKTFGYIN